MHREIRSIEKPFTMESSWPVFFITFVTGLLLALDLWPLLAPWLNSTFSTALPVGNSSFSLGSTTVRWSTVAAILGGTRALWAAMESLLAGRTGADLALALAVLAALFLNQPLVAAEVVFIGLIGECLEAYTFGKTQQAIRGLVETFPHMCLVYRRGERVMVPLDEVQVGELVEVLPGKRVPVDGIISEGHTAIDESNLTGESIPVEKSPGSQVLAGTVNQMANIKVVVQRVSQQTIMGQVIETTAKALQAKGKGERTADRMARYFLPVVLILALATFLVNWWWLRGTGSAWYQAAAPALAVLVVACPCALILATPAATMAALARLARTGILVKRGLALERLAHVQRVVFDKTGTLTTAQMSLGQILPVHPEHTEDSLLSLAANYEQASEHPLAQAIVREAKTRGLPLMAAPAVTISPGLGLLADERGVPIHLGNARFLMEHKIPLQDDVQQALHQMETRGQTPILIARNHEILGILGIWDTLRPDAAHSVQELRELGLQVALLSGDRSTVVQHIASITGIQDFQSECLPQQKAEHIRLWKEQGPLAMVGDGVNDAPALASADVGLAISSVQLDKSGSPRLGSDIAAESSDIVLLGAPLASLPLLIRLSRQMVEIIHQNILWFAIGVNIIGIALIAWLMPSLAPENRERSPLYAAIYHQIGSLLVLLNSIRLLWFEKTTWLQKLAQADTPFDRWLESWNLHDLSHWILERRQSVISVALVLMLTAYLASMVHQVPADSIGIVNRCGALQAAPLPPGLHLLRPWPWDRVHLLQPELIRRVEVGFRRSSSRSDSQTWSSEHRDSLLLSDDEALMLTADGNLIEVQAILNYTIADAITYLAGAQQLEELLRAETEAALREVAAGRKFEQLLTQERAAFQEAAWKCLCLRTPLDRLGIQLVSLAVEDLHPPIRVVKDYYEVTKALAARSRLATEARLDQEKNISRETVNATRVRAEAEGKTAAKVARIQAECEAFHALHFAIEANGYLIPLPTLGWCYWPSGLVTPELSRRLAQYHLVLEAGELVLGQRPKILRDPKLQGSLQLIPDNLPLRLPRLMDTTRTPPQPELP